MAGLSSCCAASVEPAIAVCPSCLHRGRSVDLLTVKATLDEVALRRLQPGSYRFCAQPACQTVYFDPALGAVFTSADVRGPVWQKQPAGSRTICYCFGENEADIRSEIEHSGRSRAPQRVRAHIAAGRCACEVRNPRGLCCLGDLVEAVRRQEQAVAESAADRVKG
jgi:hypothetical protein